MVSSRSERPSAVGLPQSTTLRSQDVLRFLPEEQNPFVGVEDGGLQLFLRDLSKIVDKEFRKWPIPASTLFFDRSYQTAFRLKRTNSNFGGINWLLAEVRRKKILVELPYTETADRHPRFDKDRVYAFGALTWAIQQMYQGRSRRGNFVEISKTEEEFP